mmetsp:Transcript_56092/g.147526  ORF Transcript_56092/g.147526 Transcript_56092/m.147526 type:complete len:260 (+) Transcript_56092:102-881(+)
MDGVCRHVLVGKGLEGLEGSAHPCTRFLQLGDGAQVSHLDKLRLANPAGVHRVHEVEEQAGVVDADDPDLPAAVEEVLGRQATPGAACAALFEGVVGNFEVLVLLDQLVVERLDLLEELILAELPEKLELLAREDPGAVLVDEVEARLKVLQRLVARLPHLLHPLLGAEAPAAVLVHGLEGGLERPVLVVQVVADARDALQLVPGTQDVQGVELLLGNGAVVRDVQAHEHLVQLPIVAHIAGELHLSQRPLEFAEGHHA